MEIYDFNYKKNWLILFKLWMGYLIFIAFYNISLSVKEGGLVLNNEANIAFLRNTSIILIVYFLWLIIIRLKINTEKHEGKIVYSYVNKNLFLVNFRIEYFDKEVKEKKYIETSKILRIFDKQIRKHFFDNKKYEGFKVVFYLHKKRKKAYLIHIEDNESDWYLDDMCD